MVVFSRLACSILVLLYLLHNRAVTPPQTAPLGTHINIDDAGEPLTTVCTPGRDIRSRRSDMSPGSDESAVESDATRYGPLVAADRVVSHRRHQANRKPSRGDGNTNIMRSGSDEH